MFRLLAYFSALGVNAADSDMAAVQDPQLTIQNSHFLPNEDTYLLAAYVLAASATKAKIDTPKLRQTYLPYIRPVERAALPPNRPLVCDYTGYELLLKAAEEIKVLQSNNLGAATESSYAILFLGDRMRNIQGGPIYTMRCTSSPTGVANAWASGNLTFDQTLPAGRYQIVGLDVFGTGLVAGRLILPGYSHRPGVIAGVDAGKFAGLMFRYGNMGVFGEFTNTALPQIEVMANAGGAVTTEIYMDLIKIG